MKRTYHNLIITLSIVVFWSYSNQVLAQNKSLVEQLKARLAITTTDTGTIMLKAKLAFEMNEASRETATKYLDEAEALSQQIDYPKGLMMVAYGRGMVYDYLSKFDSSRFFYNEAIRLAKELGEKKWEGDAYVNMGLNYTHLSKFPEALKWYDKAQDLAELINDPSLLAKIYRKKANLMLQSMEVEKGIGLIKKAIAIYEGQKDSALLGESYGSLGWAYKNQKQYDSTIVYMQKALKVFEAKNYVTFIPVAYTEIGNSKFETGKYDEAIEYFTKAEKIYDTLDYKDHQDGLNVYIGNTYLKLGNYQRAGLYYLRGLELARESHDMEFESSALYGLYQGEKGLKHYPLAMAYFEQYDSVRTKLTDGEQLASVTEMTEKYEAAKKEKQIQEQQFELAKKNYWIYASVGFIVFMCLLGYNFYRRYRLRQDKKLQAEIIRQQDISTRAVLFAEEKERQRIARELHDGVGQMMSAAKMNLSSLSHDLSLQSDKQKHAYERIVNLVDESCKEVRAVSHQMMPNALLKKGLVNAIHEFIDQLDNRFLKVDLYSEGLNDRIDSNTETVLYRVVQECVNNVIKHSAANHLDISLIKDSDGISVTIEDNGRGFEAADKDKSAGIGLKNIETRVRYLKGTVEFNSKPGNGTLVAIHVPAA